jgi:polyhydroxyalkanoate synthase
VTQLFGGAVRFVLASSGHIAGIINPPGGKGSYWVNPSAEPAATAAQWRETATRHDGSWWSDWAAWLTERAGPRGNPPKMGSRAHPTLEDAPGLYVLEK